MQKDDLIRQLSCMKQRTMNLLTENDIHALNQVIKLIEDLKKYRKEAKRWKRKYLMLRIEKEKDRITKEEERQCGMTKEERDNAIRCLKMWIEKEPYLQTYKTCLEALEATSPRDVVESTKIKAMQELINESYCKGFIDGKEEGLRETNQEPKVTTTSTNGPMVMQYPQVDGITPTVVKIEQEPTSVKHDTFPVKLQINKVYKHISNIDIEELEQEPTQRQSCENCIGKSRYVDGMDLCEDCEKCSNFKPKQTEETIDKYAEQEPSETIHGSTYGGVSWGGTCKPKESMREFTEEEAESYSKALDKMYKPTGFNVFNDPCDDAISRKSIKYKLQEKHDFFVNAYGGFSNLPQNDKSRVDEITNCIAMVVNEPSVRLQEQAEDAYDKVLAYLKANVDDFPDYHEAIEAVLKMKGGK